MSSLHRLLRVQQLNLKVVCCGILCCAMLSADGAKQRCGSDLLNDLLFVCGDRGIYFGKGSWSGYGPRPRGRGIVDQCCRPGGCGLHVLERYCAKPKGPTEQQTPTTPPGTSAAQTVTQTQQRPTQNLDPRRGEGHRRRTLSLQRGQGRGRKWASRRRAQQQQQNIITTVQPLLATSSRLFRAAGSRS